MSNNKSDICFTDVPDVTTTDKSGNIYFSVLTVLVINEIVFHVGIHVYSLKLHYLVDCERDVVFVLDNSNALTPEQYEANLMFLSSVVDTLFDMGGQFAVVSINDNPRVHINFIRDNVGKTQLQSAVRILRYILTAEYC